MPVPVEIAAVRRRHEIVKNACLENLSLFSSLPQDLLDRLSNSQRLAERIYKKAIEEFEEFPSDNRLIEAFLTSNAEAMKGIAKILGVAFNLPTFGSALNRAELDEVRQHFDEIGMKRILNYARLASDVPIRNYQSLAQCFMHMEADGWVMIELWARSNGVNPRWRVKPDATEESGISMMPATTAITLVNQAMVDLANDRALA